MNNTRGVYAGAAAVALSAGLLFTASPASAASVIDLPQPGGNTVQVAEGGDVFLPQFALWPIPNNSDNHTDANTAIDRGNNTTGQAFLFGFGAGNVLQFATGGNIVNPQFAVGTDNNGKNTTEGNFAGGVGNGSQSDSTGQTGQGLLVDGNGNVFQVAILQGNIVAPQVAVLGNNNGDQAAFGNYVDEAGNGSTTNANNGFAFVTGNGQVIQIEILSDNIIAPQLALGGNNNLVASTTGNDVYDSGNESGTNVNGSNPLAGIFAVTGNGNVTHIALLSNNVIAPQIAPFGTNTSNIFAGANDSQGNGNASDTTGNPPTVTHPVLDPIRSTLNQVTGNTNRPVLDAIEKSLPQNQFGNGNTQQHARDSGSIFNPQIGGPTIVAPVKVTPEPEPPADLVRESFVAEPVVLAGDNKNGGGSSSSFKGNWTPGDGVKKVVTGVKKVVAGVKSALSPKPKDDAPA